VDTGIGISKSNQTEVFSEFFQVGNPERDRTKGLGLGLSIVNRTCELLDHKLHLQSELGKGSTFTIELEVADANDIEQFEEISPSSNMLNARVLVIDDERLIREGMKKMLTPWGCEVLAAESEREAMMMLKEQSNKIDIIIADYRLADGKLGTDAVSSIHKTTLGKNVPAIIITGDTGPEQLKDVQSTGYHLLHKPVAAVRMRTLMQNLLGQSGKRR
jgi:CheY-like chemotaxis protein